jgi:hypothetical protein
MTKKHNITQPSLIMQLRKQDAKIFAAAKADGDRTLTDEEFARHDALGSTIANSTSAGTGDRAILLEVAYERVERLWDKHGTQEDIAVAYAALCSIRKAHAPEAHARVKRKRAA